MKYKKLISLLMVFGIDLEQLYLSIVGLPKYLSSLIRYQQTARNSLFPLSIKLIRPMLSDRYRQAGSFGAEYFYQDIWAAKKILQQAPIIHTDIGSRIEGFISHLLCYRQVSVIDIRPMSPIEGINFIQCDATHLNDFADNSLESISSLHAVEHFGLGRYGDSVDPEACFHAMKAFQRVLKPGGRLYFSVPIGRECVYFNAHRIFNPLTIINTFYQLELLSFSVIDDKGKFISSPNAIIDDYLNANHSCGLFEFIKPVDPIYFV